MELQASLTAVHANRLVLLQQTERSQADKRHAAVRFGPFVRSVQFARAMVSAVEEGWRRAEFRLRELQREVSNERDVVVEASALVESHHAVLCG